MSTSVLLVCAVLASLALGVLLAYGICVAMFEVLRMQATRDEVPASAEALVAAPSA